MSMDDDRLFFDDLKDLRNYTAFSVSQVVAYFERHGIAITKTTIQNYVKIGLLPPADSKKRYTRRHVMLLKIITDMKRCHSLERIKGLLAPLESPEEADAFFRRYNESFARAQELLSEIPEAAEGGGLPLMQLMSLADSKLQKQH